MTPDFSLVQGDRAPSITATLTDATGAAVNLTGGTVTFKMRILDESRPAITGVATIVNAATGAVRYDWASGDTDTPGVYLASWTLTLAGKPQTFPAYRVKRVLVEVIPKQA